MKRLFILMVSVFISSIGISDEITGTLNRTHQSVDKLSSQLSSAMDGLSHALGKLPNRPTASDDIDIKSILNGLKQLSSDPNQDPNEGFDSLQKQEAKLRKELTGNIEQRENVRKKHQEVMEKIKNQIALVMNKAGYEALAPDSSTYKRGQSLLRVTYQEGEIKTDPIKFLPPVSD